MLDVSNLRVTYESKMGAVEALRGVDVQLAPREIVGIVGESGSGKSTLAWSILGLVPRPGRIVGGTISLFGRDLTRCGERELREIRGRDISLVAQAARSGLNPLFTVGTQIANVYRAHSTVSKATAHARMLEMLAAVSLADPERIARSYPHEISGGMAQRAMIAMALICSPKVLIADEPTTGLDSTVQVQILDLIARLARDSGTATMLVTHDLSVVAQYCDRAVVLRYGMLVETNTVRDFFRAPKEEYSRELLAAMADF
jgi:ABC-type dipeptide/oligopeptide/nickel transport system ATPase component